MWRNVLFCIASGVTLSAADLQTNRIDEITGLKGKWNDEEKVYKVSAPRTDIKVSVDMLSGNRRDTEPYLRWCGRTVRFYSSPPTRFPKSASAGSIIFPWVAARPP